MLKVTITTKKNGTLLSKVISKAQQIAKLWDDLENFERIFNNELKRMKQVNHLHPHHVYRLKASGTNNLAIWNHKPDGEPNYMVAVIKYEQTESPSTGGVGEASI